jgi:hypothetical protein
LVGWYFRDDDSKTSSRLDFAREVSLPLILLDVHDMRRENKARRTEILLTTTWFNRLSSQDITNTVILPLFSVIWVRIRVQRRQFCIERIHARLHPLWAERRKNRIMLYLIGWGGGGGGW